MPVEPEPPNFPESPDEDAFRHLDDFELIAERRRVGAEMTDLTERLFILDAEARQRGLL